MDQSHPCVITFGQHPDSLLDHQVVAHQGDAGLGVRVSNGHAFKGLVVNLWGALVRELSRFPSSVFEDLDEVRAGCRIERHELDRRVWGTRKGLPCVLLLAVFEVNTADLWVLDPRHWATVRPLRNGLTCLGVYEQLIAALGLIPRAKRLNELHQEVRALACKIRVEPFSHVRVERETVALHLSQSPRSVMLKVNRTD